MNPVVRQSLLALFSLFIFSSVVSAASFEFHTINVGQGDSLLVKSPEGKLMLIDCGTNGKGATVINYLKSIGVTQIDFLVASHYDADHIGGCDEVLNSPEVSVIEVIDGGGNYTTQTYRDYADAAGARRRTIGDAVDMGSNITVSVLQKGFGSTENDKSIILGIAFNKLNLISGGDCGSACENNLVDTGKASDLEVYKVHHHGSKYSSTQSFLNLILPEVSIISVGSNSYGHPTREALNRLKSIGSAIYRTDKNLNIKVSSDNGVNYQVAYYAKGKPQAKSYTAS
ncbi:TPA: MBL fold metallo-hydrolase [Candidatus Micrarchaeota archaeon]|nr:MBL fold metallo-hydrolase [Candidatus Micrarchaeota archaeon]